MHCVDLRQVAMGQVLAVSAAEEIEFVNLTPGDVASLATQGFGSLRALSLRHLRASDLSILKSFPNLEILEVWQSDQVHSLKGLESLKKIRWLALQQLGPLPTLAPISELSSTLDELLLMGGIWKDQKLSGDFNPIASLTRLRRLTITNVRGPSALGPLLYLPRLEHLWLATALFPVDEVARVAAHYSFWREQRPWFQRLRKHDQDREGCPRCGGARSLLLLKRQKRIWCEACDSERLGKVLAQFESLIDSRRD